MKEAIIQTFNLTKIFGKDTIAVKDLSLTVSKGIYGILGPNGAGKTTTIKMLIGSLFPTAGQIEIFGKDAFGKDKIKIHDLIGYVPENPTYFMGMTAERLLDYVGSVFRLSKQERNKKISSLLQLVELTDARSRVIAKYSAGMKQRIGIAQALMNDPQLLILDEITSNLDPLGRNQMIELLKDLRQEGKTMFISTHILPEIQKMDADSIGILDHGHLIMEGTIKELNERLGEKLIRISPKNEIFIQALKPISTKFTENPDSILIETKDVNKAWNLVAELSLKNEIPIREFRSTDLEIEQLFMKALDTEKINNQGEYKHEDKQ